LKKIVFLIIASLLLMGLVLPGMVSGQPNEIDVLIAGPMEYTQGQHMMKGAELAATEIGTFDVGGTDYVFNPIEVETDEIDDYAGAGTKLLAAITANPNAEFVLGGFRTEGVMNEIPVACGNNLTMFICGAATYSLLQYAPYYQVVPAYAMYKYLFRGTPFNDVFLLSNSFLMLSSVAQFLQANYGITTPKVAIFAESLTWCDSIVATASALIPGMGWTLGPVARVSDKASSTQVDPLLNAIETAECHIIYTVMSGDVGTVFSIRKGALDIPAVAVGINVEAQPASFWDDTVGNCAYEITMGTWAPNIEQTTKTATFLSGFTAANPGEFPIYTAATYDVLKVLKTAMQAEGSVANEDLISWYEDISNVQEITSGYSGYYPRWVPGTYGEWQGISGLAALNSTQVDAIYGSIGYNPVCNFTMPPYNTHDLIYGPGYVTGLAVQWQPTGS